MHTTSANPGNDLRRQRTGRPVDLEVVDVVDVHRRLLRERRAVVDVERHRATASREPLRPEDLVVESSGDRQPLRVVHH